MLKKLLTASLVASSLLSSAVLAEDDQRTKEKNLNYLIVSSQWEIGATANYAWEGRDEDPMENSTGLGIRGAYRFLDAWSVVAEYDYWSDVDSNNKGQYLGSTDIHRFIASLNADMWPEKRHSPYAIGGVGYEIYPDEDHSTHKDGWITSFGFGYRYKITTQVSLAGEAKWRHNFDHNDDDGAIFSLGLNYHFLKEDEEDEEKRLREQQH